MIADSIRVILVSKDPKRRDRDADALSDRSAVTVTARTTPRSLPTVYEDADCIVTDDPDVDVPADAPPVVLFADVPPPTASNSDADGFVRRTGDGYDRLADQIGFVAERRQERDLVGREAADKIHRLHEGTADIVASRSMDELYERTVDVAEEILEFDVSYLLVREEDQFVPRASSSVPTENGLEPVPLDYGLTGHTYETGQSFLVEDMAADPYADPAHGDYGSGFSVPVGDWGVFQATAKEPGGFDSNDVELAELLLSYANETHRRIAMEATLRDRRTTIERLHESTADIVGSQTASELAEQTVTAAENVLAFEACVVLYEAGLMDQDETTDANDPADGDDYVLHAASGTALTPPVGSHHDGSAGLLGETIRTGESQLVDDAHEHDVAAPHDESYRSALSVPIGDYGVFQAISQSPGTYDAVDRRLAELLIDHVREALSRILAEATLRDREAELVEERDRLAALFENVPDAVAEFAFEDGDPIVRDVNGPFEDVFGFERETLIGENIDEYIVPQDREPAADDLNEKLLAGERLRRTVRRRTDDGVRDFLLHVVPMEMDERNVQGYAIYTDVTDQKRRERTLKRKNERLDQFARIVSHDLRNPLNVAQGNLDLARSDCDEDCDPLARVAESHDRMNRMIDELLSLARHGDIVGDTVPVELREAVEAAWENVYTANADLHVEDDTVLVADRERFIELLENLFRNATEHAGSDVTVIVGTWAKGIYVADDGPGIPEDERNRVFESGFTTAGDGTGFGLSIVEQIAEAHGWSVAITDSRDNGARFEFVIPEEPNDTAESLED